MAHEIYVGRIRAVVTHSLLSIVTLGLWFLVWYTLINLDLQRHRRTGVHPAVLTLLFIVPVIGWFLSPFLATQKLRVVQEQADADHRTSPWYPAILGIVPIVGWAIAAAILQSGANRAWARLHQDLGNATDHPVTVECPDCTSRFDLLINPFAPHSVACPKCGRAGVV